MNRQLRKKALPVVKSLVNEIDADIDADRKSRSGTILKSTGSITNQALRKFFKSSEIRPILEEMLEQSSLGIRQKAYIKALFMEGMGRERAIRVATSEVMGTEKEQHFVENVMQSDVVREFKELMKLFYLRAVPIAALKEVELILDKNVKDGVKIEAIKDIQDRAEMGPAEKAAQLPVKVIINIPTQTNVKVEQK